MQLHLLKILLIHEGIHAFKDFRHGIGQFLHGAGILTAHKQYVSPMPQRMRQSRNVRPHDDVPVLPQLRQHVMLHLHAVGRKPAFQSVAQR